MRLDFVLRCLCKTIMLYTYDVHFMFFIVLSMFHERYYDQQFTHFTEKKIYIVFRYKDNTKLWICISFENNITKYWK